MSSSSAVESPAAAPPPPVWTDGDESIEPVIVILELTTSDGIEIR